MADAGATPQSRALVSQSQQRPAADSPSQEDVQFMRDAEANETAIRELQFQLGRVEDLRRAAVKETSLVREIKSINALTQRKVDAGGAGGGAVVAAGSSPAAGAGGQRPNQLPLTAETRAQIIALEDEMRNETRRTAELQEEAKLTHSQIDKLEREIAAVDAQLAVAERATGRPRTGGVTYHEANLENVIGRLKAGLAKLDEEQRTTFSTTTKLTRQIDDLGAELEAMSEVDRLLAEAQHTHVIKTREHELLLEEVNRQERIAAKKEKHIASYSAEKDVALFKRLETDKKMLHVEQQKAHEARRIAARAVEVNAVALRRLEAQLGGIAQTLALVFVHQQDVHDGQRAPAPHAVPIRDFEEVQRALEDCRRQIAGKDAQIEAVDAEIEALERKVDIVQVAQQSRQSAAYLGFRQLCKERDELRSHLAATDAEFRGERQRLEQENELLERHTHFRE